MKAVVIKSVGVLEVQDVPEPECGPDEIKVKIAYAGICGTDPKIVDGTVGAAFPEGAIGGPLKTTPMREGVKILGHEASGTIVKIGKDIKGDFKVGQHVAMNFRNTCGACYYCDNEMEHFCERVTPFTGVMAEYGSFKESLVFALPDDLPLDVGAFLEPLSIAVHTIDIAKCKSWRFCNYYGRRPYWLVDPTTGNKIAELRKSLSLSRLPKKENWPSNLERMW